MKQAVLAAINAENSNEKGERRQFVTIGKNEYWKINFAACQTCKLQIDCSTAESTYIKLNCERANKTVAEFINLFHRRKVTQQSLKNIIRMLSHTISFIYYFLGFSFCVYEYDAPCKADVRLMQTCDLFMEHLI